MRIAPLCVVLVACAAKSPASSSSTDAVPTTVPSSNASASSTAASSAPNAAEQKLTAAEAMKLLCGGPDAIPLENAGSRHFVQVEIEGPKGKETLRFHVDTGGNTAGLMLDKKVADRMGFSDPASMPTTVTIGGKSMKLPEGASWTFFEDENGRRARKGFSVGQIGAGFLSRFIVCIDPAAGKIGFGDPAKLSITEPGAPEVGLVYLLMQTGGKNKAKYPFIHALLEAKGQFVGGYGVLLDTGAPSSMLDVKKIDYQHGKNKDFGYFEGASGDADMLGSSLAEKLISIPSVKLNTPKFWAQEKGLAYPAPTDAGSVLFVSRPDGTWDQMFGSVGPTMGSHGAIANDVLNRFRMLIDYESDRLFVVPTNRAQDASASMTRVGVSVRFGDDGCPEIRAISSTNVAATKKALQIGDIIKRVDDKDACAMMHHELAAALAGKAGDTKKLSLLRGKKELNADVKVADLLAVP